MKSFEETKNIYEEAIKGIDMTKEHPEKFMISLLLADPQNVEVLKEFNIELKRPSEWIVLTKDHELLKKTILRAKDLGFLEAYQQTPSFLKQEVDAVIKRISELDHLGIPYNSEKGKYQSFLFSQRGYAYVLEQMKGQVDDKNPRINDIVLKDLADRLIETFAMENKRQEIYEKLAKVEKEGLTEKETLIETFKAYSDNDNIEYLNFVIDEIIAKNNEMAKGRAA